LSPAPDTTSCEAGAGGMSSAQAVAMTKSPQAQDMTAFMGEEAVMSFAEAMAQIVSSASVDLTGSSVAGGTTS